LGTGAADAVALAIGGSVLEVASDGSAVAVIDGSARAECNALGGAITLAGAAETIVEAGADSRRGEPLASWRAQAPTQTASASPRGNIEVKRLPQVARAKKRLAPWARQSVA
jgi:hypothetical protein